MRDKPAGETARPVLDLVEESGLDTGWKKDLTGGPHPSMTQGRGTRLSVEEERGKMLAREGKLGRGLLRAGPRGKTGERFWAFGPISREREEEKNKYFSNFIFRPLLN